METATESLNAVEDAMKSTFNCVIKIGEVIKLEQGVTHHGKKRTKRRRKASAKHAKGVRGGKSAKLDADKEKWKLDFPPKRKKSKKRKAVVMFENCISSCLQ